VHKKCEESCGIAVYQKREESTLMFSKKHAVPKDVGSLPTMVDIVKNSRVFLSYFS